MFISPFNSGPFAIYIACVSTAKDLAIIMSSFRRNPVVSTLWDLGLIEEGLNAIDWSSDTIQSLEDTVQNSLVQVICASVSIIIYRRTYY